MMHGAHTVKTSDIMQRAGHPCPFRIQSCPLCDFFSGTGGMQRMLAPLAGILSARPFKQLQGFGSVQHGSTPFM